MKRRRFLAGATVAIGSLSGCVVAGTPGDCDAQYPPEGFLLQNMDPQPRTVEVTVIYDLIVYTDVVHQETYELSAVSAGENEASVPDIPTLAGNHIVRVRLGETTTDYLWKVTPGGSCDSLQIVISQGDVTIRSASQGSSGGAG